MNQRKTDRQREHQANERTFLAWLRTSIALIGFGFAITRFGLFLKQLQFTTTQQPILSNPVSKSENLGLSLVILGIVVIALATWRYNRVFWQIEKADYRPNRIVIWFLSSVVILLGIFSILLFLVPREAIYPSTKPVQKQSRDILKIKLLSIYILK